MARVDANTTAWLNGIRANTFRPARRQLRPDQDVNVQGEGGVTALHIAVESGCMKMVESLVNAGADINVTDDHGRTPLRLAQYLMEQELAAYLIEYAELKRALEKSLGKPPTAGQFYNALNGNRSSWIRRYEVSQQINAEAAKLINAAQAGNVSAVRAMVETGESNVDFFNRKTGETVFSAALASKQLHVCDYLMEIGDYAFGSCIVDGKVQSTLMTAVLQGNLGFLRRFLAHRAVQSTPAYDPKSCVLSAAIQHGSREMIEILIGAEIKFNLNRAHHYFPSVVGYVITNKNLASHAQALWQRLCIACWCQDLRWVKHLFASEHELQDRNMMKTNAANALFLAAYQLNEEIVDELLARGAQLDSIGAELVTAMIGAVYAHSVRMLQFLLDRLDDFHVPLSAINRLGKYKSLLVTAVVCGAMECAHLLLPLETDPDHRAHALERAMHRDEHAFACLLLEQGTLPSSDAVFEACAREAKTPGMLNRILTQCCGERFHVNSLVTVFRDTCRRFGAADLLKVYMAHGFDVKVPDWAEPPLLCAVNLSDAGDLDVVKLLLDGGFDSAYQRKMAAEVVESHLRLSWLSASALARFAVCRDILAGSNP